jgi:hypothetical protein
MAAVTFATNIALEGGATIDNLRVQAKNTLPAAGNFGDVILVGNQLYGWGNYENTTEGAWMPFGLPVSQNGLDELSELPNTLFSENQGRLLFNSLASLSQSLYESSGFFGIDLSAAAAITEKTVVNPQDPYFSVSALRAYVVTASAANKIIRVKNNFNSVQNDTIPLLLGDILLPVYRATDNSWYYHVLRTTTSGSATSKKFHRIFQIFEQTYSQTIQNGENAIVISCEDIFVNIAHDGTTDKVYDNTIDIIGASAGIRLQFEAGIQVISVDYTSGGSVINWQGSQFVSGGNARLRIAGGNGIVYVYKS